MVSATDEMALAVRAAEAIMGANMHALCVTRELADHCEDVRGWELGHLPEPDWAALWRMYKEAECELEPWPTRREATRESLRRVQARLEREGGSPLVTIITDPHYGMLATEWRGGRVVVLGPVWDGHFERHEREIDSKDLGGRVVWTAWRPDAELADEFGSEEHVHYLRGAWEAQEEASWTALARALPPNVLLVTLL